MSKQSKKKELYTSQYETIQSDVDIYRLLSPKAEKQTQILVSSAHNSDQFDSAILSINLDTKQISIMRLKSTVGHERLLKTKIMHVSGQYNGADISFTTSLIGLRGIKNSEYLIAFPKKIKYLQRRTSHRVHVSLALAVTASFVNPEGGEIEGQLRDISTDGMRIQFSKTSIPNFQKHAEISNCTIKFPDDSDLQCTFNVCHIQPHASKRGCTVGVNFLELETDKKRTIEKFIANLERSSLRGLRL